MGSTLRRSTCRDHIAGSSLRPPCRLSAPRADRILEGEKPRELPVQAPVKFELAINPAKALGLDVPLFLQQRADDVIE